MVLVGLASKNASLIVEFTKGAARGQPYVRRSRHRGERPTREKHAPRISARARFFPSSEGRLGSLRPSATGSRVIVFVDGDFWHGKNWKARKVKLKLGHNANYWIRKIESNAARDLEQTHGLRAAGWIVLRIWESDISANIDVVVRRVEKALRYSLPAQPRGTASRRNVPTTIQAHGSDFKVSA